jgi:hypothetical protein
MEQVWRSIIRECPSLASFNRFVLPLAKAEEPALKKIAANEATRRGYKFNAAKKQYE